MKARRLVSLSGVLFVVCALWLAWFIHENYRFETLWRDQGPSPEARKNPYHAAEVFLARKGIETRVASVLPEVIDRLESTDTLMLFYDHDVEYRILRDTIDHWVKRGGHLVITVHYLWDEENKASGDEFLDALGVRQYLWPKRAATTPSPAAENEDDLDEDEGDTPADDDGDAETDDEGDEAELAPDGATVAGDDDAGHGPASGTSVADTSVADTSVAGASPPGAPGSQADASLRRVLRNLNQLQRRGNDADALCTVAFQPTVARLDVMPSTTPLQIAFEPDYHIEDVTGTAHAFNAAEPVHMLEYRRGAGKITVLTDYFIFNDDNIGELDHAFLLWWLVQESPRVWMVHDKDSDSLISLIWESAPWLVVSALLLLGGHLLYRGRRFGPARTEHDRARRQWLEHIDASADLLWRSHQPGKLLAEARQHIYSRFPGMQDSGQLPVRLQNAAEQAGIPQDKLVWALTAQDLDDENEFVEIVQLLQHIRMSL